MNILIKKILLFYYIFLFSIAYTKNITPDVWKKFPNLLNELTDLNKYPHIQTVMYSKTPIVSTLFRELNDRKWNDVYSTGLLRSHDILLKEYSEEAINVKVYLQDHPAPILYVLPGTLTSNSAPLSLTNMKYYHDLGFHVVFFSNPWAYEVLNKHIKNMGDLESQAKLHWSLIEELENHIIPQNIITQRKILGKSYGALLATIILNLSHKAKKTLDELILISPTDSLLTGATAVDNLIDNYRNFNLNPLILVQILSRNMHKDFISNPETSDNAKAIIAQFVFLNNLSDVTAAALQNVTPIGRDKFNLKTFIKKYYPDSIKATLGEKGSLDYWFNQLRGKKLLSRVKLIMSENDPLSKPGYGKSILQNFSEVAEVLLPGGGHNLLDHGLFNDLQKYVLELTL